MLSRLTLVRTAFALAIALELWGLFFLSETASDFTWLGLILTGAFAWAMVEMFRLSAPVAWLAFALTILDGVSALFELYSRVRPWDAWMHFLGGAAIAAAALELTLRGLKMNHLGARRHGPFITSSVYLVTVAVGFLYEFLEYLVDKFQYGHPKSLVSAYDSIEDQLLNILGATLVLAGYRLWHKMRGTEKIKAK